MIIEGLLTSIADDGSPHVAPMGPSVDPELQSWTLRPFQSSTTFKNLRRTGTAIFHVVDDVLPVVQSALDFEVQLSYEKTADGNWLIKSACHWFELQLNSWKLDNDRAEVNAVVVRTEIQRPFWGWNRAKHAVLEATILATRLHLTGVEFVRGELFRLDQVVAKTAGPREIEAWQLVLQYVERWSGRVQ